MLHVCSIIQFYVLGKAVWNFFCSWYLFAKGGFCNSCNMFQNRILALHKNKLQMWSSASITNTRRLNKKVDEWGGQGHIHPTFWFTYAWTRLTQTDQLKSYFFWIILVKSKISIFSWKFFDVLLAWNARMVFKGENIIQRRVTLKSATWR